MVTRSRRRGDRPRHAVTVEEPETEAFLRAELKVRIHSPPAKSLQTISSAAAEAASGAPPGRRTPRKRGVDELDDTASHLAYA